MKFNLKEIIYYFTNRLPKLIWGKYVSLNLVNVHWGRGLNNFGDCLQPYILNYYGLTPVYSTSYVKSDIILEGSILENIPIDFNGFILGTGGHYPMNYRFPYAKIIGVRGELSRQGLDSLIKDKVILGDTGLLMAKIFDKNIKKKYDLGVIFHFSEVKTECTFKYKERFKNLNVIFINVLQSPKIVINQIKECSAIISSSLHGLIIADAFNIPNRRIIINEQGFNATETDYKYLDYYSSFGWIESPIIIDGSETVEELISQTTIKPIESIDRLIKGLDEAMQFIANKFKYN